MDVKTHEDLQKSKLESTAPSFKSQGSLVTVKKSSIWSTAASRAAFSSNSSENLSPVSFSTSTNISSSNKLSPPKQLKLNIVPPSSKLPSSNISSNNSTNKIQKSSLNIHDIPPLTSFSVSVGSQHAKVIIPELPKLVSDFSNSSNSSNSSNDKSPKSKDINLNNIIINGKSKDINISGNEINVEKHKSKEKKEKSKSKKKTEEKKEKSEPRDSAASIGNRNLPSFTTYIDENEKEKNQIEEEQLPDRIEGTYIFDYDIFKIHHILDQKFEQNRKKKLDELSKLMQKENLKIKGKQNLIERKTSRNKIAQYEKDIKILEEKLDKKEYLIKAIPLLEEYEALGSLKQKIAFSHNNKSSQKIEEECSESEERQLYRHEIIGDYLEIARKYINIDLMRKLPNEKGCPGCGLSYEEAEVIEDDSGLMICPGCGLEKIKIVKSAIFADNNRVNNSRNNYEDRANFEKVVMRYQGKQITKPPKELYDKLEAWFLKQDLYTAEHYNSLPLNEEGRKEGTSKELMMEALSGVSLPGYYDDINLICHIYFGWSLPDISHLEEAIMKDYDDFQRVYEGLDKEGRKSSLNSQWKLWLLLKRRGWPCKAADFKIPTTPSILDYHKIISKQVYQILGWDYL